MTAAVGARNLLKVDAGVVHALLQARYYDGNRGEFLSEDPVFLGDPKQQVLTDPSSPIGQRTRSRALRALSSAEFRISTGTNPRIP